MAGDAGQEGKQPISPLIKWPGGKRALAPAILDFIPQVYGTYYEPFLGGGAIFFALLPTSGVLSDTNAELINAYVHVRDYPDDVAKILRSLRNTEQGYYEVRSSSPRTPLRKAARTLYLTRLAFNGIHRVNLKGEFNVPYGHKTHLNTVDLDQLQQTSEALQGTELLAGDFESISCRAQAGDVLYFDPPYTVAHANNGFVKYNERIFSWQDQERLASHALALAKRGCRVIISNADHPSLRNLYRKFDCYTIERHSVIAAASEHRRPITECIFVLGGE
jgi:DNA adenine methylase